MENKIELSFDGSFCYIKNGNQTIDTLITTALTYEDKSLSYMAYKTGRSIDTSRTIYDKKKRRFPTGCLSRVYKLLVSNNFDVTVTSTIEPCEVVEPELPDWLYEHQVKAIKSLLQNPRSAVQSPTGSGKTAICTYLIKAFPSANVLVTVPSSTLLDRTAEDLKEALGEEIGRIGGGKKEWKRVTVGIINSVINYAKENPDRLAEINVCIQDECHGSACNRFLELSGYLTNCYYCYGLSATIERADGKLILIEGGIGPTVLKITEEEVSSKKVTLKPTVIKIPFKHTPATYKGAAKTPDGSISYRTTNGKPDVGDVYKQAVENNPARDNLLLDILEVVINSQLRKGGILVLVKGVNHGKMLSLLAKERGIDMPFLSGDNKIDERLFYLEKLRNRQLDVLCSTSIFNQGEDIKPLECVLLACAGSNKRILIQQLGRVTRVCEGKEWALFIDIEDKEPFYLSSHSDKRDKIITERHNAEIKRFSLKQLKNYVNGDR